MTTWSKKQLEAFSTQAGFGSQASYIIVAIALAESGGNDQASHVNTDGSIDRGVLEINSRWHPEVSDSCAYTPLCSFQSAYNISNKGTDFNPWTTYTTGAYLKYLTGTEVTALGSITGSDVVKKVIQPLTPNSTVGQLLTALDILLALTSPFDISQTSPDAGISSAESAPVVGAVIHVFANIADDLIALIIRFVFLLLGFLILKRVFSQFIDVQTLQQKSSNVTPRKMGQTAMNFINKPI